MAQRRENKPWSRHSSSRFGNGHHRSGGSSNPTPGHEAVPTIGTQHNDARPQVWRLRAAHQDPQKIGAIKRTWRTTTLGSRWTYRVSEEALQRPLFEGEAPRGWRGTSVGPDSQPDSRADVRPWATFGRERNVIAPAEPSAAVDDPGWTATYCLSVGCGFESHPRSFLTCRNAPPAASGAPWLGRIWAESPSASPVLTPRVRPPEELADRLVLARAWVVVRRPRSRRAPGVSSRGASRPRRRSCPTAHDLAEHVGEHRHHARLRIDMDTGECLASRADDAGQNGAEGEGCLPSTTPDRRVRIGTVRVTIGRLKYVLKHFEFDPMPIWVERCRFGGPGAKPTLGSGRGRAVGRA